MQRPKPQALLLVAAGATLGCGVDAGQSPYSDERSTTQALVRAETSPLDSSEDAIVLIRTTTQTEHICSGTLVASNLVLTSRHCIAYTGADTFQCTVEGELIDNPNGGGLLGAAFPPEEIEIYDGRTPRTEIKARGAEVISPLSNDVCTNDIAFVVLDRKLELPSLPIRIRLPTRRGELVKLVGYGSDGTSTDFGWQDRPRRRLAHQRVLGVGPDSIAEGVGSVRPRTLMLSSPAGCFGDSGGPALSEISGAVIGVFSILDRGNCDVEGAELGYTHTSPFEDIARRALESAGAEPMFEDDRVLGEACTLGHECQSGQCIENAQASICSEACDADPCPSGFVCSASGNGSWCVPKAASACADCGEQTSSGCSLGRGENMNAGFLAVLLAAVSLTRKRRPSVRPARGSKPVAFAEQAVRRRWLAARVGLLMAAVLLFIAACGEDELILGDLADGGAGASGSRAAGGASGLDASGGRAGSSASGGTLGAAGREGGSAADAAADGGGGGGGASNDSSTGCKPDGSTYKLDICTRLTEPEALTRHGLLVPSYMGALHNDCRVARLVDQHPDVPEFISRVELWSLGLIGCHHPAVADFALSDGRTPLTAADVAVLIEIYMRLATLRLSLSPGEAAELKQAVECLGRGAVTDPSTTSFTYSSCRPDAGADGAGSDARAADGSGGGDDASGTSDASSD